MLIKILKRNIPQILGLYLIIVIYSFKWQDITPVMLTMVISVAVLIVKKIILRNEYNKGD